ncbi:MAG: GNAT family N-acetyltransferase, partial [Oscillospiraceae bacterium]|nr:GNAT family N-acetyltransferase [Oscillospiraceae bacterium]
MKYNQEIILKNGAWAHLRNGDASDGLAVYELFNQTHAETDYLLSYPDENSYDPEQEAQFLKETTESSNEIEIIALVDGKVAGMAGIEAVGKKYKVKHRAEFGISILRE